MVQVINYKNDDGNLCRPEDVNISCLQLLLRNVSGDQFIYVARLSLAMPTTTTRARAGEEVPR